MLNSCFKKLHLLILTLLSMTLIGCGSSKITDFIVDAVLTTEQKQLIAKLLVTTSNPIELTEVITRITSKISELPSGAMACTAGSSTLTTVNTPPLDTFNNGDSIILSATNCQSIFGLIDGKLTINGIDTSSSSATETKATFSKVKVNGSNRLNGTMRLTPSNDYSPTAGTGNQIIKLENFAVAVDGETLTLTKGDYIFTLSGNNYSLTADETFTFSKFPGDLTAKTVGSGFTGTSNINASNHLNISSPLAGEMIITYPGDSKATVLANTGNKATYSLTVDKKATTEHWDW